MIQSLINKAFVYLPYQSRVFSAIYKRFCDDDVSLPITMNRLRQEKKHIILDYAVEGSTANSADTKTILLDTSQMLSRQHDYIAIKPSSLTTSDIRHIIKHSRVPVIVDAEQSDIQKEVHPFIRSLQLEFSPPQGVHPSHIRVINTYQCYLKSTPVLLNSDIERFRDANRLFGIKLVRGAYLDYERARNPYVLHETAKDTHQCYDRCLLSTLPLTEKKQAAVMIATHNEASVKLAMANVAPGNNHVMFAQLKGMGDDLSNHIIRHGYTAYKYVPFGPREQVAPYLLRRLHENPFVFSSHLRALNPLHRLGATLPSSSG